MRPLRMEDRCVKLAPEEVKSFEHGIGMDVELNDDVEIVDEAGRPLTSDRKIVYKSLAQLRRENVIKREEILQIHISGEYQNIPECRKDFVQSIEVENLEIQGRPMSGTIRKFYCPYCKKEIIPQAGKMPLYLVSLMGPSSAGKTVYLTILHMLLSGRNYRLPEGYLSFDNIGEVGKEFREFEFNIRRHNVLPSTTQENRKDPYLLHVVYQANPGTTEINKQCLLGLIDMRGEMLSDAHKDDLADFNVPQFKEADGFIMLVDPETLDGVYNRLPENTFGSRRIDQLYQTLDSMKEAIGACITSAMGKIDRPSVVALAKQDILLKNYAALRIPLTEPVIAPNFKPVPGTFLGQTYYGALDRSTKKCINHLSGNFTMFLNNTFKNPYYVSLSALGNQVQIRGDKIDNYEKIQPIRVEEPLLKLLMDFNFLPRFYMPQYYEDPQYVMEGWGKIFAETWSGWNKAAQTGKKKKPGKK